MLERTVSRTQDGQGDGCGGRDRDRDRHKEEGIEEGGMAQRRDQRGLESPPLTLPRTTSVLPRMPAWGLGYPLFSENQLAERL